MREEANEVFRICVNFEIQTGTIVCLLTCVEHKQIRSIKPQQLQQSSSYRVDNKKVMLSVLFQHPILRLNKKVSPNSDDILFEIRHMIPFKGNSQSEKNNETKKPVLSQQRVVCVFE